MGKKKDFLKIVYRERLDFFVTYCFIICLINLVNRLFNCLCDWFLFNYLINLVKGIIIYINYIMRFNYKFENKKGMKPYKYDNGIIYKLCCRDVNVTDIYIGSTIGFTVRENAHKTSCNNKNAKQYNSKLYQFIRNNGGWDNWDMIIIEQTEFKNSLELHKRERYYMDTLHSTLNVNIPSRTASEYYKNTNYETQKRYMLKNKESIRLQRKEYLRQYHINNKERIRQYKINNKEHLRQYIRQYKINNKDILKKKIMCECGVPYQYSAKRYHLKTKKHLQYVINPFYKLKL